MVLRPGAEARLGPALTAMRTFSIGASWGGTRSLLVPVAVRGDRTAIPLTHDGTVLRIGVEIEDPDDLKADLDALLAALG